MSVESKHVRFDVPAGSTAITFGDPDMYQVTVPEGEVWYVESFGYDSEDGEGSANPGTLLAGISAADNPPGWATPDTDASRGAEGSIQYDDAGDGTLGAYAYGGETIAVGVHNTDNACKGYVGIRRVL